MSSTYIQEQIDIALLKQKAAYTELKLKITQVMFDFTNKYAARGENCLYPHVAYILIKALEDSLEEAKEQAGITRDDYDN